MPRTIRLLTLSLLAAVGVFTATACGDEGGVETTGSGIEVVATTTQVGALTRAVAGDNVALTVLHAAPAHAHH